MAPLDATVATSELDLKSPQSKQDEEGIVESINCTVREYCDVCVVFSDFTSLSDVEHHFVGLIKWEGENGVERELRIYSKIAHKWKQIATQLGLN